MKRTLFLAALCPVALLSVALLGACSDQPQQAPVTPVQKLLAQADALMAQKKYVQADKLYAKAWNQENKKPKTYENEKAFWILMHALELKVRQKNYQAGMEVARLIGKAFGRQIYIGNALFHLRVGQCQYEMLLEEKRRPALQELQRALQTGGIEIFDGEDPKYLAFVTKELDPPDGYADWAATRGSKDHARERMNAVTGFLRGVLEKKLGGPPPY